MRLSDQQITLSQLEGHLWESANILRGPVDAADFKTYIFPLLFFKRICDVWDEEYQEIVDETGDEQLAWFPESHRFQIPEDCHWNDVRTKASNVGTALQRAMREIEKANPDTLYGVFGDAQWSNKDRLSDALLKDLIEHFSKLPFGNKNVNSDLLGDAYEYLIKKFADATNKKAGEFYTPRSVVRLMIDMLDPKEGETIYDPACGTGGMLLAAVQHVKEQHGDVKRLWGKLYGQEKNLTTSSIARMNLFLHGIEDFQVVRGDTLRNPAFFEVDRLATFDCVIANPPFSLEKWGEDQWMNDPFGRNFAGLPPSVQRRLRLGAAHGQVDGRGQRPHGRGAAAGRPVPQRGGRQHPPETAGDGSGRGRDRAGAQPVLRHRPRRVHPGPAQAQTGQAQEEGADRRCVTPVPPGPRAELSGARARRRDPRLVSRLCRCAGRGPRRQPRRDQSRGLDAEHFALCPAAIAGRHPAAAGSHCGFKDALTRCREAEERLAQVMTEGGWLQ